jgi:hypothetical protein
MPDTRTPGYWHPQGSPGYGEWRLDWVPTSHHWTNISAYMLYPSTLLTDLCSYNKHNHRHCYAGRLHSLTHLSALLVLHDRGVLFLRLCSSLYFVRMIIFATLSRLPLGWALCLPRESFLHSKRCSPNTRYISSITRYDDSSVISPYTLKVLWTKASCWRTMSHWWPPYTGC